MFFERVWRSAILPTYINSDDTIEMLVMKPADSTRGGDKFQIAKGKIEGKETPLQTALREGEEELGLLDFNIKQMFYEGITLGRTHFFIALVRDKEMFSVPFPEETAETKWLTKEQFEMIGRNIHRPLITRAEVVIQQWKNGMYVPEFDVEGLDELNNSTGEFDFEDNAED